MNLEYGLANSLISLSLITFRTRCLGSCFLKSTVFKCHYQTIKIVFILCIYIYNSCYWHLICQDGLESDKVVIEHGESQPLHIKHRPETKDFSPHFGDLGHLLWGNWRWFCRWPSIHGTMPLCRRANVNAWTLQLPKNLSHMLVGWWGHEVPCVSQFHSWKCFLIFACLSIGCPQIQWCILLNVRFWWYPHVETSISQSILGNLLNSRLSEKWTSCHSWLRDFHHNGEECSWNRDVVMLSLLLATSGWTPFQVEPE